MARSLLDNETFRLHFAGHETFPLRYGWLKKAYDAVRSIEADSPDGTNAIFTDDSAIARFGVGKNMVFSIRHWALATQILMAIETAGARTPRLTTGPVGELLFGKGADAYLEHPASLWLLHWMLACTPGRTTAWYWAFNEFHEPSFDRDLMTRRLVRRCRELQDAGRLPRERAVSDVTLRRDVECLIRTYHAAPPSVRRAPEDSLECPLAELGLIQRVGIGELYRFRRGPKPSLPDEVFLFALHFFWTNLFPERRSLSVDFLTYERGSPGQVFLLDEETVAERLSRLERLTMDALRWDESSGMRQIYATKLDKVEPWEALQGMYARDMKGLAA